MKAFLHFIMILFGILLFFGTIGGMEQDKIGIIYALFVIIASIMIIISGIYGLVLEIKRDDNRIHKN